MTSELSCQFGPKSHALSTRPRIRCRLHLHTSQSTVGGKTRALRSADRKRNTYKAYKFRPGLLLGRARPPRDASGTRKAKEDTQTRLRCLHAAFTRVFSTEMCLRSRFPRRRACLRVSRRKKAFPAAHLAARMEYDNAPYPMMATADAPSNAP